ncbi:MAG: hypothetical protein EOO77_32620 [Oxalobacteraceae bacterium]|nr:MAG: hypothetical protein EOO77_32620 [Oxalobacteraceae bacterium]
MTIPAFEVFLQPTLDVVAKRRAITTARHVIFEPVAERLGLSPENFGERLESGQSRLATRCEWALAYVKKAGLLSSRKRCLSPRSYSGDKPRWRCIT